MMRSWLLSIVWLVIQTRWVAAQNDTAAPVIWEHFFNDGCDFIPGNVSEQIPLLKLPNKGVYIQLEIHGTYNPRLVAPSAVPCKLPNSELYRMSSRKDRQYVHLVFKQAYQEESKDEGNNVTCSFPVRSNVKLMSGYGFVSCHAGEDLHDVMPALKTWKKMVRHLEEKASATKLTIMGGIAGGMVALVLFCVVCIVVRLRSSDRRDTRSIRRSTPTRAVNLRVTADKMSSTQVSALSSG